MRVLYLSDDLTIHDERFLSKLIERKYDTWLVTYHHKQTIPEIIGRIKGLQIVHLFNRHYAGRFKIDGEYVSIESNNSLCRLRAVQGLWECLQHFRKTVRDIRPDVVHAGWLYSSGLLAALTGYRPWLLMPWGSDVQVMPYRSYTRRMVARYVISHADMITCDCQAVKNHIIQLSDYTPDRIVIAPWGVDLTQFQPSRQQNSIRAQLGWQSAKILIASRQLRSFYGIEYIISAMPKILNEQPGARLLVCGDGPLELSLRDLVRRLNLEKIVHFTGFVPNHRLPEYLNAADVYVSPSLEDGSSLSLMEAMACALPAVVTDVPAVLEWVKQGENGFVVKKRDVEGLATACTRMLECDSLRREMGKVSLQMAELFANWEKNFTIIEEIYHRLVSHRTKSKQAL